MEENRQPKESALKMAFEQNLVKKEPLGCSQMRWNDNIRADLRIMGLDMSTK